MRLATYIINKIHLQAGQIVRVTLLVLGLSLISPSGYAAKATLNLKETDIEVFIESVSRITGKTFIIDPRVKNKKVTVISQHEMDEDEIFALFLSVLQVHQFSAVETNGVYKIEQLQSAKQDSVPVYTEGGPKYMGDEVITRVIKVDNIDVGQLVPLLRTLVSTQGHMAQYKPTNVMVIHDTAANLERIVKIIRQIDRESNEEIEVIPLEHASATEVVRILESLEKQSGAKKGPETNQAAFIADERTNSILLSADSKASLRLRALIAQLDSEISNSGNTKVVYLKYAKAEELATLLEGVGDSIQQEDSKDKPKTRGNDKGYSIRAHNDTNALVITAAPDIMRSFESVISQLDFRPKQVHVEAIIVEISDSKVKELGVQWATKAGLVNFTNSSPSIGQVGAGALAARGQDAQGSTVITTAPDGTVTRTEPGRTGGDNGAALGQVLAGVTGALFGYTDNESWAGLLKMLATDTDSNVLSTPSLTTLDNEEASISIGQEIPVITGSTLGNNNSNPFQSVDRKDVGIKLKITPQINEGDAVRLTIEQEVSSVAGATGADIVTNKRQIKTTVLAGDGQTIVLGGLIDDDIQESAQKVPLLGDIPILGYLFSSHATSKVKRNLMVFIRPTIINDTAGIDRVSSRKYNYMRAQQLDWQQRGVSLMPTTDPAMLPEWNDELALPPSFEDSLKENELEKTPAESEEKTDSMQKESQDQE